MRLIDKDRAKDILERYANAPHIALECGGMAIAIDTCICLLDNCPTIDAEPVVRCKDCRHRRHLQGATDEAYTCSLGWGLSGIVAEEDFCSYGKRKDGEG